MKYEYLKYRTMPDLHASLMKVKLIVYDYRWNQIKVDINEVIIK